MEQLGLDFVAQAERKVFTVAEITAAVRDLLEGEFFDVRIEGEISNTRKAPSGRYYFTLKDQDGSGFGSRRNMFATRNYEPVLLLLRPRNQG